MKELMTSREVSQILFVSHQSVRKWCQSGLMKHYSTPGGFYRVSAVDLLEFAKKYKMYMRKEGMLKEVI